ncbi:MAG: hypothetical protein IPN18_17545 [Ignavibacteriales bacterium]|nr:hypothetical protein [Ignavibacteriales bacterium]
MIEEVFGEIKDEYDVEENVCRKTTDNEYLIGGNVEIDSINEKFDLGILKVTITLWVVLSPCQKQEEFRAQGEILKRCLQNSYHSFNFQENRDDKTFPFRRESN